MPDFALYNKIYTLRVYQFLIRKEIKNLNSDEFVLELKQFYD